MLRNPRIRRLLALVLAALGGVALFLAPDDLWIGIVLFSLGIALEILGTRMQRANRRS